jgi:arylsulfatase A-like enzyme
MHDRYLKNRLEYFVFKHFIKSHPWHPIYMTDVPDKKAILKQGLPPGEILLPEVLKKQGYTTGLIGKWHLGWDTSNLPCEFGFDYQYGFYASHTLFEAENSDGVIDMKIKDDFTDKHIWKGQRNGPHAIYRNCVEIEEHGYLTDRITEESIDYIRNHADDPFFLWISYNAPHTPLQAKEIHYNQLAHIKDPVKRVYYAMILSLDEGVGAVMRTLKDLELEENTLVFFLSDNGGAEYTFTTDNGPYKGGKITDFEGGLKVPFFLKWKSHLPENTVYDKPVISMDIFATSANAAGAILPDEREYDGVDLLPYLTDSLPSDPHEFLYWQRGFSKAVRSSRWKMLVNEDASDTVLFDMHNDPFETRMVIHKENHHIIDKLMNAHNHWSETLPAPMWPSLVYYLFNDGENDYYFDQ